MMNAGMKRKVDEMHDERLRKEVAFLRELERGARARRDWIQYYEFRAVREGMERRLAASLRQPIPLRKGGGR